MRRLTPAERAEVLELHAMHRHVMQRLEVILNRVGDRMAHQIAKENALWLAVEERIGREPEDGTPITPADDFRAQEILRQCWADEL
jgi:hypothetical protein